MTLQDLYDWLAPQFDGPVRLGSVDAGAEHFLGLYDAATPGPAHLCLGGAAQTHWGELRARLLLRYGRAQPAAEAEAARLWGLFYGLGRTAMGGAQALFADPGAGPKPLGKSGDGVFEYEIELRVVFLR